MTRRFSLAHLTVLDQTPPQMVRMAARIGYDSVGLRLIRVTDTTPGYPLMDDRTMMSETSQALAETGIAVLDIEFVRMTAQFQAADFAPFLDVGAELRAAHVICAPYDPDHSRLSANLATFNDLCLPRGLRPVLEFFPWTNVPDLDTAIRVVEATGAAEIGILVDTLHFNRSGSRLDQLYSLPVSRLPFVHLCDAPVQTSYTTEELLHAGRAERLAPGEGQIDLPPILAAIPSQASIALEIPMTAKQGVEGSEAVARHVLKLAKEFFATPTKHCSRILEGRLILPHGS